MLRLDIIKKIVAIGPLVIGAIMGGIPMLYTNLGTTVIAFFLNSHYSGKFLGYSSWMQIKDIAPSYGVATLIAFSVYFLKFLSFSNWIILPFQLVLGTVVFFLITYKMEEYMELKGMLMAILKKKK